MAAASTARQPDPGGEDGGRGGGWCAGVSVPIAVSGLFQYRDQIDGHGRHLNGSFTRRALRAANVCRPPLRFGPPVTRSFTLRVGE